ncbi:hypothetical protein [Kitasatospora sp. NPDC058218]|uniref:hypothetical protein n=1 Tax=Kitasatospora sp. NPDC058218 TaxID=3346385 RepID=UPI0036D91AF2
MQKICITQSGRDRPTGEQCLGPHRRRAVGRRQAPEDGTAPVRVPYDAPSLALKLAALRCYGSQTRMLWPDRPNWPDLVAAFGATATGEAPGELFHHLPAPTRDALAQSQGGAQLPPTHRRTRADLLGRTVNPVRA